jgi:hypothetical protein
MLTDNVLLEIFYFYQDFYRINPDIIDPSYRGPVMPLRASLLFLLPPPSPLFLRVGWPLLYTYSPSLHYII